MYGGHFMKKNIILSLFLLVAASAIVAMEKEAPNQPKSIFQQLSEKVSEVVNLIGNLPLKDTEKNALRGELIRHARAQNLAGIIELENRIQQPVQTDDNEGNENTNQIETPVAPPAAPPLPANFGTIKKTAVKTTIKKIVARKTPMKAIAKNPAEQPNKMVAVKGGAKRPKKNSKGIKRFNRRKFAKNAKWKRRAKGKKRPGRLLPSRPPRPTDPLPVPPVTSLNAHELNEVKTKIDGNLLRRLHSYTEQQEIERLARQREANDAAFAQQLARQQQAELDEETLRLIAQLQEEQEVQQEEQARIERARQEEASLLLIARLQEEEKRANDEALARQLAQEELEKEQQEAASRETIERLQREEQARIEREQEEATRREIERLQREGWQ